MRTLFLLVYWISSIAIAYATDKRPSIEKLILAETQEIQEAEIKGAADLSLKYINRAESYIIAGKFEKALEDLEKGQEVAWQLNQRNAEQRSLVDMMIAYAYLGDNEKALSATEHLQRLFYSSDDHKLKKGHTCRNEEYVSGPVKEPAPGWCKQAVVNTTKFVLDLVNESPLTQYYKDPILYVIYQLQNTGLQCCGRGDPWKGCVGPLAKKSIEWQSNGVPQDPVWND